MTVDRTRLLTQRRHVDLKRVTACACPS
ncbi:putative leader peptide [Actinomycetospora sp. NBRC 106378]